MTVASNLSVFARIPATVPSIQVYKDDVLIHSSVYDSEPHISFFAENKGDLGTIELAKKEDSAESPYFQGGLDEMMVINRALTDGISSTVQTEAFFQLKVTNN